MKGVVKTEDQGMDNLLRAHARQAKGQACGGFDPDLANAYVERGLTAAERARYEGHLFVCHPCRKGVIALARMAEAEQPHILPVVSEAKTGWLEPIRGMFAALATPRLALTAVAVLTLAISVPLMLSRSTPIGSQQTDEVAALTAQKEIAPPAPGASATPVTPANAESGASPPMTFQARNADAAQREQQVAAEAAPAEQPVNAAGAGAEMPAPQQTPKEGDKDQPARSDEAVRDAERENRQPAATAPAPPPPAAAEEGKKEIAHIDPKKAKSLGEKDSATMRVLKPGDASVTPADEKEKKDTITAKDSEAPATESSKKEAREGGIASPRTARRERSGERAKPSGTPDRQIGGKRFWLSGDTWTDREFSPGKEIPVVTVVRNSETYRQLMAKHSGLKLYFTNFADDQSALIVYKKVAYRLVPQQ